MSSHWINFSSLENFNCFRSDIRFVHASLAKLFSRSFTASSSLSVSSRQ